MRAGVVPALHHYMETRAETGASFCIAFHYFSRLDEVLISFNCSPFPGKGNIRRAILAASAGLRDSTDPALVAYAADPVIANYASEVPHPPTSVHYRNFFLLRFHIFQFVSLLLLRLVSKTLRLIFLPPRTPCQAIAARDDPLKSLTNPLFDLGLSMYLNTMAGGALWGLAVGLYEKSSPRIIGKNMFRTAIITGVVPVYFMGIAVTAFNSQRRKVDTRTGSIDGTISNHVFFF
jgi:hypothetical protein